MPASTVQYTDQHKTWQGEYVKDNGETLNLRYIETLDFVTFSNTKTGFAWGFEGEWGATNDNVYVEIDTLEKGIGSFTGTVVSCRNFGAACEPMKNTTATFELDSKGNIIMRSPGVPDLKFSYLHISYFEGTFGFYSETSCVSLNQWLNFNGRTNRMRVTVNEIAGLGNSYEFDLLKD